MFAGECRKQKVLFAIADIVALALAFTAALMLHDPDGALLADIQAADPKTLAECVVLGGALWICVFRAFDLFSMRNGSLREAIALAKACTTAAVLMLLATFAVRFELSRVAVTIFLVLSVVFELATRAALRRLIHHFYTSPRISIPLVIVGFNQTSQHLCDEIQEEMTP
jgi:FlaA1/EpsC-like NDP-sugar epimerase